MKLRNRFVKGLLSAMILTALLSQTAFAADTEPSDENPYTFTVTIYSGNQGTFGGVDMKEKPNVEYGKLSVDLSEYKEQLQITDEKYYVKGIRLSGRDNSDEDSYSPTWQTEKITKDTDYVVAYGIKGDMVAYTVQYLDENGNELAPSNTYYGSAGDKPVVAFQYIEGYLPQAYNLTKTLSENEADNVFQFVYTPASETNTIVTTEGGTGTTGGGTATAGTGTTGGGTATAGTGTAGGGTAAAGTAGGGTAAGGAAGGGNEAATEDAGGAGTDDTTEIDEDAVPQGTIDLDEDQVPKGNKKSDDAVRETSALPIAAGILIAVAAVAIIIGGIIYYRKHTK